MDLALNIGPFGPKILQPKRPVQNWWPNRFLRIQNGAGTKTLTKGLSGICANFKRRQKKGGPTNLASGMFRKQKWLTTSSAIINTAVSCYLVESELKALLRPLPVRDGSVLRTSNSKRSMTNDLANSFVLDWCLLRTRGNAYVWNPRRHLSLANCCNTTAREESWGWAFWCQKAEFSSASVINRTFDSPESIWQMAVLILNKQPSSPSKNLSTWQPQTPALSPSFPQSYDVLCLLFLPFLLPCSPSMAKNSLNHSFLVVVKSHIYQGQQV